MISVKNTYLHFGHIKHEAEWDNNPPFYYYCLWVWASVFNVSELSVRFLSTLFFSLGVGALFLLVKRNLNFITAFSVCLFLSLSYFFTFYSHEARAYTLVFMLSVISSVVFFNFLNKPDFLRLALLSLINFLLIYTHYVSGLVVFGQYIFVLLFQRKQLVKILIFQTFIVGLLVYLRFTAKQYQNIFGFNKKGDFWLQTVTLTDLKEAINQMFFSWPLFLFLLGVALLLVYFNRQQVTVNSKRFLYYCLLIGVASFLILYITGIFKAVFLPRYIIFTIPFILILLVFPLSTIGPRSGTILCLLVLIVPLFSFSLHPLKGQPYNVAVNAIRPFHSKSSCVLINTSDNVDLFLYYFDKNAFENREKKDSLLDVNRIFGVDDTNKIDELGIRRYKTVFLVQSFNKKVNNNDYIQLYLKHNYEAYFYTNQLYGTDFSVYTKK